MASDELKGRYPGTPEDEQLARYLASEFKKAGLQLYEKTGVQTVEIVQEIEAGPENHVQWGETEFILDKDYSLFPFSNSASVTAEVVFAGYGFQIVDGETQWDDYKQVAAYPELRRLPLPM